jgi:hypothetical protein
LVSREAKSSRRASSAADHLDNVKAILDEEEPGYQG